MGLPLPCAASDGARWWTGVSIRAIGCIARIISCCFVLSVGGGPLVMQARSKWWMGAMIRAFGCAVRIISCSQAGVRTQAVRRHLSRVR